MDKTILRAVTQELKEGDTLKLNLLGNRSSLSGEYKVTGKKVGRGKGGSLILLLQSLVGDTILQVGTPQSDEILNIVVDGKLFGYESKDQVPVTYETNAARAIELKKEFQALMKLPVLPQIQIDAPQAPEIHGLCTVTGIRKMRGRHGQIVLTVTNPQGQTQNISSYRHSGVITITRQMMTI